jgi:hypothetical protein
MRTVLAGIQVTVVPGLTNVAVDHLGEFVHFHDPRDLAYANKSGRARRRHLLTRSGCATVVSFAEGEQMSFTTNQVAGIVILVAALAVSATLLCRRIFNTAREPAVRGDIQERRRFVERDTYEGDRLIILLFLIAGSIGGIIWTSEPSSLEPQQTEAIAKALREMSGLSPGIQACYTVRSITSSMIIAAGFGISLGVTYLFGNFLYRKFRDSVAQEREQFWTGVASRLQKANGAELSEIVVGFTNYEQVILDRRNLYWSLFLRATLALLVVAVIALLIAVCKIESQAGLPIITGIIAFIIGQGSDIIHGPGTSIASSNRPIAPVLAETTKTQEKSGTVADPSQTPET